jgi:hypothetical protein
MICLGLSLWLPSFAIVCLPLLVAFWMLAALFFFWAPGWIRPRSLRQPEQSPH